MTDGPITERDQNDPISLGLLSGIMSTSAAACALLTWYFFNVREGAHGNLSEIWILLSAVTIGLTATAFWCYRAARRSLRRLLEGNVDAG
jgi:ABC-type nickel/cobalt efflux system permease component RcnA